MLIEKSFNNSISEWKYLEQDNWRKKQGVIIDLKSKINSISKSQTNEIWDFFWNI
jgi:hypothetical protein